MAQGEFIEIGLDQSEEGSNLSFPGAYAEGSWVLTGEPRSYDASAAAFKRPNPEHPLSSAQARTAVGVPGS